MIKMEEGFKKKEVAIGLLTNDDSTADDGLRLTRKILAGVSNIVLGKQSKMYLENLSAQKDWIHEKEYLEALQIVLQQDYSRDYVIATGITTTVRDFVKLSFASLGVEVEFCGKGDHERGVIIDKEEWRLEELGVDVDQIKMGQTVVKIDAKFDQSTQEDVSAANFIASRKILEFESKYTLDSLINDMSVTALKLNKK